MHFVTGGAFNGKAKWVKEFYDLKETPHLWISAYSVDAFLDNMSEWNEQNLIILEGIETYIKTYIKHHDLSDFRLKWQQQLRVWKQWEEQNDQFALVLIGTDITKGIVPINAEDRKWRDATGWAYQETAQGAERVDLIWYGVRQKLK